MTRKEHPLIAERITDSGRELARIAVEEFAIAADEPDANARAKLLAAANQTMRSAMLADRAVADRKHKDNQTKLERDADRAAMLAELDS